nr:uncharacterized protein LOC119168169 [Rhipicephalus microplus]
MADVTKRITELEVPYQGFVTVEKDVETIHGNTAILTRQICDMEARVDDAENRSRRNNLIFYGLPDPNPSEKFSNSEEILINHCRGHLNFTLDPKLIERAHRLGRHRHDHKRPIIVKFTFLKTKEEILSNGRKLNGTKYSIGEDFSESVRKARKHLVEFARTKFEPFSVRYKTLFLGKKRYVFNGNSQTVNEIS